MRVINKERGKGKTTGLLYTSSIMNIPILTFNRENCNVLKENAYRLGFEIPEPIAVSDLVSHKITGAGIREVLVDESLAVLDSLLKYFGANPVAVTLNAPKGIHTL